MNNEIKEILKYLKIMSSENEPDIEITREETKLLLDYITNLRTIEQQYSALLSENAELQNKYNKALELLCDYNMPCEIDEFMDVHSDWCEINCSHDGEAFKKCWDKFIEWKIKDE